MGDGSGAALDGAGQLEQVTRKGRAPGAELWCRATTEATAHARSSTKAAIARGFVRCTIVSSDAVASRFFPARAFDSRAAISRVARAARVMAYRADHRSPSPSSAIMPASRGPRTAGSMTKLRAAGRKTRSVNPRRGRSSASSTNPAASSALRW